MQPSRVDAKPRRRRAAEPPPTSRGAAEPPYRRHAAMPSSRHAATPLESARAFRPDLGKHEKQKHQHLDDFDTHRRTKRIENSSCSMQTHLLCWSIVPWLCQCEPSPRVKSQNTKKNLASPNPFQTVEKRRHTTQQQDLTCDELRSATVETIGRVWNSFTS